MSLSHTAGCLRSVRTPADADEHPLAQLVGGVGEDDGGVEVAALSEHPEEVGRVEIVEGSGDEATPDLHHGGDKKKIRKCAGDYFQLWMNTFRT